MIEQVKDKTHDEQVSFLMEHMHELRDIVTLFSSARDMYLYDESDFGDEVLANLMIYRYENHISILDDEYCKLTKDYVKGIEDRLYAKIEDEEMRKIREEYRLRKQWEAEHPEEAKAHYENELRSCEQFANELEDFGKKILQEHDADYWLNYNSEND